MVVTVRVVIELSDVGDSARLFSVQKKWVVGKKREW